MSRIQSLLALCLAVLLASQASAQVIVPGLPQLPQNPGAKELQDFQRQLQQALEMQRRELAQALAQQGGKKGDGSISWGGVKLLKADANLQQQLGLEANEGLVVSALDPNSAADKAGLKVKDVLVKINDKAVPNDPDGFIRLVKDQKVDQNADLVIVRDGKEQTLKGTKMPALAQAVGFGKAGRPGGIGIGGKGGIGGIIIPPIRINPGIGRPNPLPQAPGQITKLHIEMNVNGAKVVRKLDGDQFSGEYIKDDLKIAVSGKLENGQAKLAEIVVTQGKETNKYTATKDVPAQHRAILQQLVPSNSLNGLLLPGGLPGIDLNLFPPGLID
jgi:hypothetical protein